MATPTLVLASRSPSRARLLRDAGYAFKQLSPCFQDPANPQPQPGESPAGLAQRLAREKARSVFPDIGLGVNNEALILTADTLIVAPQGHLLGQPRDRHEAQAMLESLVNRTHRVVTAVCLAPTNEPDAYDCFADEARVRLGEVPADELERYLDSQDWRGKAGGYNVLELRSRWPFAIDGDPTTVVGLPMTQVKEHLQRWAIVPTQSGFDAARLEHL